MVFSIGECWMLRLRVPIMSFKKATTEKISQDMSPRIARALCLDPVVVGTVRDAICRYVVM